MSMSLTLRKGEGQGHVKLGHQIIMLRECRTTHILWVIWDAECDGDIISKFVSKKGQCQVRLCKIRSNFQTKYLLTKTCLPCPVLYQNLKKLHLFYVRQLEKRKKRFKKVTSALLPVFWVIAKPKIKI